MCRVSEDQATLRGLKTQSVRADLLMLLAALIWGCSFVAQRLSLATIGPFFFTGIRFLLGALVVAGLSHWLKPAATSAKIRGDLAAIGHCREQFGAEVSEGAAGS